MQSLHIIDTIRRVKDDFDAYEGAYRSEDLRDTDFMPTYTPRLG